MGPVSARRIRGGAAWARYVHEGSAGERLGTGMCTKNGRGINRHSAPVTVFVARFLLQDMGVLAGRFRHGFCPQSSMIRGVLPPEPTWRPVDR